MWFIYTLVDRVRVRYLVALVEVQKADADITVIKNNVSCSMCCCLDLKSKSSTCTAAPHLCIKVQEDVNFSMGVDK